MGLKELKRLSDTHLVGDGAIVMGIHGSKINLQIERRIELCRTGVLLRHLCREETDLGLVELPGPVAIHHTEPLLNILAHVTQRRVLLRKIERNMREA